MGFELPKKYYNLHFEDPDLNGAIVKVAPIDIATFKGMLSIGELANLDLSDPSNFGPDDIERVTGIFDILGKIIVEWNLTKDGEAIPVSKDGIESLPLDLGFTLVMSAMEAVGGVSIPLDRKSTVGKPSAEPLLPMEALS